MCSNQSVVFHEDGTIHSFLKAMNDVNGIE
jgi:hypothetical protein